MASELNVVDRIRLRQLIDRDLDACYQEATELGKKMGQRLSGEHQSQLRHLESIAAAATRTSALKNHVKNQTGKDRTRKEPQTWACPVEGRPLGEQTLELLEKLGGRAATIVKTLAPAGLAEEDQRELARSVEIELQRGLVQTAVCAALYGNMEATK